MMCDPLRGKKTTGFEISAQYDYLNHKSQMQEGAYPKGQVKKWGKELEEFHDEEFISRKDIVSAIRFYKKYVCRMTYFKEKFPKEIKIFEKEYDVVVKDALEFYGYHTDRFNGWLFDYCFGDVI